MYPASFEYVSPKSLDEALSFLESHLDSSKVLAGGHSLIPLMKLRVVRPAYVIDIAKIPGLSYIKEEADEIRIGALTTYYEIETSDIVKRYLQALAEGVSQVADPQVRNWGTLGGSLCHCDPAGDAGSCVLALRGRMVVQSKSGKRVIESDEWFVDTFQSALKPNEILTEIVFPKIKGKNAGAYLKLERRAGDYAIAAVAVQISLDSSGVCSYAGIGLTAVGNTNLRAKKAEQTILGKTLDDKVIEEAAQAASEECKPVDDPLRGSAEYKRAMVKVLTKRALKRALERAKGGV